MRKKILIMDDEVEICKQVADFLVEQGYNAIYALDGQEGLTMIEKDPPELLILDIQMPKLNGLQVLTELTERFPHLTVVVVSGFLDQETTSKVIEHGAAMCIDKPIELETLHRRVVIPLIGPAK